jgi:uncharacterized protein YkwD
VNASRRLAAASVAAALAACAYPAAQAAPATTAAPPPASTTASSAPDAMALEVGRLVNAYRVRIGCHPLLWDSAAARAAQAHTDDMVRRGYFAHESPEGQSVGTRLHNAGGTWRAVAENIASGQRTAQGVVQGWLDSPGHRRNIENCTFTRQGVGHRANVWTHVFYNVGV